ncbi:hypothetical protein ACFYP9_25930 [Streptomyces goshikiensis]|uniref:hypothetical protein n=1 Tax=Streptomyces goshikiensis TaxID=1942 RepID=UPI0036A5BFC8
MPCRSARRQVARLTTEPRARVDADVPTATAILRQGLEAWLSDLKATPEARTPHQPN